MEGERDTHDFSDDCSRDEAGSTQHGAKKAVRRLRRQSQIRISLKNANGRNLFRDAASHKCARPLTGISCFLELAFESSDSLGVNAVSGHEIFELLSGQAFQSYLGELVLKREGGASANMVCAGHRALLPPAGTPVLLLSSCNAVLHPAPRGAACFPCGCPGCPPSGWGATGLASEALRRLAQILSQQPAVSPVVAARRRHNEAARRSEILATLRREALEQAQAGSAVRQDLPQQMKPVSAA